MGYKEVSITICDDCLNYDLLEESKIIHKRHIAYFCSALMTTGLVMGLFYWASIVIRNMDNESG
jgi:hypothetical protein